MKITNAHDLIEILKSTVDKCGFSTTTEEDNRISKAMNILREKYSNIHDPWGLDIDVTERTFRILWPLYKHYFRVRVFGKENIQDEAYMICSNHTGQLPIDGILVTMALALEMDKPRLTRTMVERFLAGFPFLGTFAAQHGAVLGDRKNCMYLMENGESILVFPEGVRGISKSTYDFYKLQNFTRGFFRIALQTQTNILPIAVVGAEEMFPFVMQSRKLANWLGIKLPSIPLSLNYLPLPSPIDIYIGKPYEIPHDLSPDAPEKELNEHIFRIQTQIKRMIAVGLKNRRSFADKIRIPINDFVKAKTKNEKQK